MSALRLDRLLEFLTSIELVMGMLWLGLAIFTICLAVLMYTRWGQYKPLRKCMAMSLLAHLLLAGYAATVEIITPIPRPTEQVVHVLLSDGADPKAAPGGPVPPPSTAKSQPWEVFSNDVVSQPAEAGIQREPAGPPVEPQRIVRAPDAKLPGDPALNHVALAKTESVPPKATAVAEAAGRSSSGQKATAIEAPAAQRREASGPILPGAAIPTERLTNDALALPARVSTGDVPAALLTQIVPLPRMNQADVPVAFGETNPVRLKPVERMARKVGANGGSDGDGRSIASRRNSGDGGMGLVASSTSSLGLSGSALSSVDNGQQPVPNPYRLRVAPNRIDITEGHGGTAATEAAVKAALKWLADNQAADGRWNPRTHEAGKENNILGRDRQSAGSRADNAITGLALLSFLGSGHTHLDGPYRQDVRRGLEYLMRTQASDGNLGGQAATFEFMYCHAMAACALSEAYGMTHDQRLRGAVSRAIQYTVASQDPKGGGWRYRPGDAGDTSQLGWQLMSLKSAELAGIPIPERTRQGVIRYLQSVSAGKYGGRASYRPGEMLTRPMTAEALVCWQFLGLAREHPACNEAGDFLLSELPGQGTYNLYYWYYATLGMYQLQDVYWRRWNEAIRTTLVGLQVKEGPLAGSWNTNDLWGGHGGRVYTTSLAALTLEVYYRFLPLYIGASSSGGRVK